MTLFITVFSPTRESLKCGLLSRQSVLGRPTVFKMCVQRGKSPTGQPPHAAAAVVPAVEQPSASPPACVQHAALPRSAEPASRSPAQQQPSEPTVRQPEARAASAEPCRQPMPLQRFASPPLAHARARPSKPGCASCRWCPAGCEQCRADYGRGLAVSFKLLTTVVFYSSYKFSESPS